MIEDRIRYQNNGDGKSDWPTFVECPSMSLRQPLLVPQA